MLFLTCTEHTSTMSPELMKLRIMVLFWNFMMCVELKGAVL